MKFAYIFLLSFLVLQCMGSCPENLCDCDWSTPSFGISALDINVGSITISVCDVLPNAVEDLYHDQISGFKDLINNGPDLVAEKLQEKLDVQAQLNAIKTELMELEDSLGIDKISKFFSNNNELLNKLDTMVDSLENAKDGIIMGIMLPTDLVKMFPKLLNGIKPDAITDFIKEKGEKVIGWFTDAILSAARGVGEGASCSTCLVDNLENGLIAFEIGVDTGPGLTFNVHFGTTQAIECMIDSIPALSIIMIDLLPNGLEDGWDGVEQALITSAQALVTASQAVSQSKFCELEYDIPAVDINDVGFDLIDDFTNELEKMINIVGNDGPFAEIMQIISDGVCDAASSDGFENFAVSLKEFLDIVSFSGIEKTIMRGMFKVFNRMGENLDNFMNTNFNVDTDTCNQNNRNCQLAVKYGKPFVSCIKEALEEEFLAFNMGITFGEHWAPPSVAGFAGALSCTNVRCLQCVFGVAIDSDTSSIAKSLKFVTHEVFGLSNSDNKGQQVSCPTVLNCGANGVWNDDACACKCNDGYLAGAGGCHSCPTANGKVCNGKGACYMDKSSPKCCCLEGITTANCS